MSVAWFTKLYRLNEAGRFDEAITASERFLAQRPKDYALHLQRAKALLSVGRLDEARTHLDAAVKFSKGLAAWPWFYRAALHARRGERRELRATLDTALRLDPKLKEELAQSPFFAAYWSMLKIKPAASSAPVKTPSSPRAASRSKPAATSSARATSRRPGLRVLQRTARSARGSRTGARKPSRPRTSGR